MDLAVFKIRYTVLALWILGYDSSTQMTVGGKKRRAHHVVSPVCFVSTVFLIHTVRVMSDAYCFLEDGETLSACQSV